MVKMFGTISDPCESADCPSFEEVDRSFCANCDCTYCDYCWDKQAPHRLGKLGQDGRPHGKSSKDLHIRLRAIFETPHKESELRRLHQDDEDTLWFGIDKDETGACNFDNTSRYATLMTLTKQPTATERYPLLVSFVGETGAGKSTLVKMLVSLKESNIIGKMDDLFRTPITGSARNDQSPTSGDVHLYIDPQSAFSDLPMLYADCEGLHGGEALPQSNKFGVPRLLKSDNTSSRKMELPPTKDGKIGTREAAVHNVYPRLLYTFSDVIVFVLKNAKTFESVALRLLLEWASRSIESSVNQAVLPQLIIVLNDSNPLLEEGEWDVTIATERLMKHADSAIHSEPLKSYVDRWAKKGRVIKSCKELIKCYYADFHVVRIPSKGQNMLIKEQIDKLHRQLQTTCQISFQGKLEARQYCTTDELNRYLEAAFDHFAKKPNKPFDFIEVALKADPIPQGFSDHISMLAFAASTKLYTRFASNVVETFEQLSKVVASCILLDCIRYKRLGKPEDLFDQHFAQSCSSAVELFNDVHVQCGFTYKFRPCVNSRANHEKGHQDPRGKITAYGDFQLPEGQGNLTTTWLNQIRQHLVGYENFLQTARTQATQTGRTREVAAYELHRSQLMIYFGKHQKFAPSRKSCYGCLMEIPQHPLPCGHMLCTACVQMLGRPTDKNTVTVDYCPFEPERDRKIIACHIRFKPNFAGVRILSLDGGGVRGIVELESLRAIQAVLGKNLPIQAFFDLIVGTSTGGLIALGLGVKQWTVDQCITRFIQLCTQAFTPNEFATVKYIGTVSRTIFRSKYKTSALRDVLKKTFEDDVLYGTVPDDAIVRDTKVCVTTTSITADSGIAIGNYTRQSEDEHWYKFLCGDRFKVWEAAAATTAAPTYFKRFRKQNPPPGGTEEYLDGALYFNNPVRIAFNERRFLWPDVADCPPDIVLSLGTGKNGRLIDEAVIKDLPSYRPAEKSRTYCSPDAKIAQLQKKASMSKKFGRKSIIRELVTALVNRFDSILDAEREYKLWAGDHAGPDTSERYVRLNPDLNKDPIELDNTASMLALQEQIQRILRTPEYEMTIYQIAYRLVASSFYFSKDPVTTYDDATRLYTCTGRIACRFEGDAPDMRSAMRNLGEFFRRESSTTFRPYFTVKTSTRDNEGQKVEISRTTTDDMCNDANLHFADDFKIQLQSKQSTATVYLCLMPARSKKRLLFPISGFPRAFLTEDASTALRLEQRAKIIKTKARSTMLVGHSLFDYYLEQMEAEEKARKERNIALKKQRDSTSDLSARVGSPELENASPRDSIDGKSSIQSGRTVKRPVPEKTVSDNLQAHGTPTSRLHGQASMPLLTGKGSNNYALDLEDERLVNALRSARGPASSAGADIIEASEDTTTKLSPMSSRDESTGDILIRETQDTSKTSNFDDDSDSY